MVSPAQGVTKKGQISVCMPCWNRQAALDRCLQSYAEQYGPDQQALEFSVCDDGSSPPVHAPDWVLLTQASPPRVQALNPCLPLNRAVRASHGDIIVLTNPEVLHATPILWEMWQLLDGPLDYVTARCRDERTGMWLAGSEVDYSTGGRLPVPPGAHFHFLAMLRRELWEKAGGFDKAYRRGQACDDNDWLWRLAEAGARFRTTTQVAVHGSLAPKVRWGLPFNGPLFECKWPAERRAAVVAAREEAVA